MKHSEINDDLGLRDDRFKLCFVTGMWQRHNIFEMFAEGVDLLRKEFCAKVDIQVAVSGSEGRVSRDLAENYRFHYVETPNQPLGAKMNKSVELARMLSPDYCLMLGSDDLIGSKLMARYVELMEKGIDFVYLTDCYFFDTVSKGGLYWGGYIKPNNKGDAAGIGKLISKNLLDKINWNCFPPGFDRILDTGFDKQIRNVSYTKEAINLQQNGLFALDIKSQVNMTPFARWPNANHVNGEEMLFKNLPEQLAKKIYGK